MNRGELLVFFLVSMVLGVFHPGTARCQTIWQQLHDKEFSEVPVDKVQTDFAPNAWCIETTLNHVLDSLAEQTLKTSRIAGFRILLYSGNNRTDATKAKERAYRLLPHCNVYTTYQQPTFKVKTGDFYEKMEAFLTLKKLESAFPQAVLVPELVSLR